MDEKQSELVNYFISETNKKFDRLEKKVDLLIGFRWSIIGGSVVLSLLVTLSIELAALLWGKS